MPENATENARMTSGELARMAGVSIRTVRYYEERGLIVCAERDEGARRLFDEEALERMRTIALMKSMGLGLKEIKGVLETDASPEVLRCLFAEQRHRIESDIVARREMMAAIDRELAKLGMDGEAASHAMGGDEGKGWVMSGILADKGTRLRRTQKRMLVEGLVVDAVELAAIIYGVTRRNWWPFALWLPMTGIVVAEVVRNYHRDARYVCPHCHKTFQPAMREFFWATHTPRTRKLTCPSCGEKDWCVEVSATGEAQG